MKAEFIPKVITLFAGAVVCIVCIIKDMETVYSLEVLLATLIVFYIIGCIVKRVIVRVKDINTVMKRGEPKVVQEDIPVDGEDADVSGGYGNGSQF